MKKEGLDFRIGNQGGMRVLVACEFSGTVRDAFIRGGMMP